MNYRILNLIQQDRSAGIHEPEKETELDPKVLEVFQWLGAREAVEIEVKTAADLDLDEAIEMVGGHKITESKKFKVTFNNKKFRTVTARDKKEAKQKALMVTGRPTDMSIIGVKKVEEIK